jgi:hypothetical protein
MTVAEMLHQPDLFATHVHPFTVCRPAPDLEGVPPAELLTRGEALPGTFRLGTADGKHVQLLGEAWLDEPPRGELAAEAWRGWLVPLNPGAAPVEEEEVEAALEASGFSWRKREASWVVLADSQVPREVQVFAVPGGLRLESTLVGWDELGSVEAEALAHFLCRAQLGLRFARCELNGNEARLAATLRAQEVEQQLAHCVGGIVTATRLLHREAGVLLSVSGAKAFLAFFVQPGEKVEPFQP